MISSICASGIPSKTLLRIAILLSGNGTTFEGFVGARERGELDVEFACVVSSKVDAYGLERARKHGVRAVAVPRKQFRDPREFNDRLHVELARSGADLLVLAGFLSKLELRGYVGRAMNVHPALVPAFSGPGFYGERVHRAVLEAGVRISGATIHYCDEEYDTGPIILQKAVPVLPDDSVTSLAARVHEVELELYPRAIQLHAEGRLTIEGRRVRIRP